ncbi:putative F-box protein PP2-B12 [Malania oleifera]|uniref:putative F-box protein PP2-B12 n=1 Tax=Malania oleifera TaxID=397392 RepID=UPI0025AE9B59|nr:putative F-box protein PP2-B12 [Malania oleifera]
MEGENESERLDWSSLPEGCIANIVSLTSPRDACRLSLVSSAFRSASNSDSVWERFLPSDYPAILSRSCSPSPPRGDFSSKKEFYFRLCDSPLLIDGGTKSFSLERCSGKKCYMLAPRSLFIVWGDTPEYWTWISLPESRFWEVAELRAVCWLEIRGKMDTGMLSTGTDYAAYLVFKFTENTYNLERRPVEVSAGVGSQNEVRSVVLDPNGGWQGEEEGVPPGNQAYLSMRGDGWREVELGEFFIDGDDCEELGMSLLEVNGGHWKRGLIIKGIEVRPKNG